MTSWPWLGTLNTKQEVEEIARLHGQREKGKNERQLERVGNTMGYGIVTSLTIDTLLTQLSMKVPITIYSFVFYSQNCGTVE